MPMNQNSTSNSHPKKRVRRVYAQPSAVTLEFLRNFARTYSPVEEQMGEKAKMILN